MLPQSLQYRTDWPVMHVGLQCEQLSDLGLAYSRSDGCFFIRGAAEGEGPHMFI
jgi:hypothetical protein